MTDALSIIASLFSIVAGAVSIVVPIISLRKESSTHRFEIKINQNIRSRRSTKQDEEIYIKNRIKENYEKIYKLRLYLIIPSTFISLGLVLLSYGGINDFFITSFIDKTIYSWMPHEKKAYLFMFFICSLFIYFMALPAFIWFYDKDLINIIKRLNFTETRIRKINTSMLSSKKINNHYLFPSLTLSRAIINTIAEKHNEKVSLKGRGNFKKTQNFFSHKRIFMPYVIIFVAYFFVNAQYKNHFVMYEAVTLDNGNRVKLIDIREGESFTIITTNKEFKSESFDKIIANEPYGKFSLEGYTRSGVSLRKTPYGNSKIKDNVIDTLKKEEYVKVHPVKTQTGWFLVMDQRNRQGFIYEDYLQLVGR